MIKDHLEGLLRKVERPGRYIGGEWNAVIKNPARAKMKIALAFPDVYEIGMSYLGQKILYAVLNRHPDLLAERVFAPWPDMEQRLRSAGLPIFSLENKIPLREFDLIGFSLLYELNYSNILTILDLAGIPFFARERGNDVPLVIAGGPAAFNPEPVADLFDAFFIGDGEEGFLEAVLKLQKLRQTGAGREEMLRALAALHGFYVPCFSPTHRLQETGLEVRLPPEQGLWPIRKRILSSLDSGRFPEKIVVPDIEAVFDRVALEIARGCPQRCRFCQATNIYFPFRIMSPEFAVAKACRSLASTGYEDVSFSALSIGDYPFLEPTAAELMSILSPPKISLSLSSLRPSGLSSGLTESILRVRKTGLTIVPEAGTDRLRAVINKNLNHREIMEAARLAFESGWRLLKLYFMIGLPTETQVDLEGIVDLVREIVELGRTVIKMPPQINLSLSSFIPKPHTPFQWLGMEREDVLEEKQRFVRSGLRRQRSVRVKVQPTPVSILEGVFSRGDRKLGSVLVQAWKRGARFDSWRDRFSFSAWREAFAAEGLEEKNYLGPLDIEAPLPWDHIESGIHKEFLIAELERAMRGERTPSCLEMSCLDCQGCATGVRPKKRLARGNEAAVPGRKIGRSGAARTERAETILSSAFGEKIDHLVRYEMIYAKTGTARYLSHRDLTSHLKRAFRRAGIEIAFSTGFHPTMLVSYAPALALGMEGKAERLEFKSAREFDPPRFLRRLNRFLRQGIRITGLRRLADAEPPLNKRIVGMVFSLPLDSEEVKQALAARKKSQGAVSQDDGDFLRREMEAALEKAGESGIQFWVEKKKRRLFFRLPEPSRSGLRPRDLVSSVLGLEEPNFDLTREGFILTNPPSGEKEAVPPPS